ncbi:MAG: DUF4836 family protein [Bacteroidetes bacterium]|nr:DUF4836 family protein [Bacteroidota bacterium]
MLKIAKKLIALSIVMVLGVLVFIWYRSSQPPLLLGQIPNDIQKAGFIDVRNLVKKAYSSGATDLQNLNYPSLLKNMFSFVKDPKEPGINLYSEIVWFQHNDGFDCLFVRLANTAKWAAFLSNHKEEMKMETVEKIEDIQYARFQNFNAVLAWKGKHLALIYDSKNSEKLSYSQAAQVLEPDAYSEVLNIAYEKKLPDLFFIDLKENQSLAVKLFQGKLKFELNEYDKKENNFSPFESVKVSNEERISDTSLLLFSSKFLNKPENAGFSDTLTLPGKFNSIGLFYIEKSTVSDQLIQPQIYEDKPAVLTNYQYDKKEDLLWVVDIKDSSHTNFPYHSAIQHLGGFKRLVMISEENKICKHTFGTSYFSDENRLPFREVVHFLLENKMFNSNMFD